MTSTEARPAASAGPLREALVARLRELGAIRSEAVAEAVLTVPRHEFVPEDTLEQAYEPERALVTKRGPDGVSLSSVSAARIQAFMLEQADIRSGMRVLEIGSGGYNAALMAELVGDQGQVTTIDIDPDMTDRAGRLLQAAGYGRVNVILADGEEGEPEHAPYDRIVVTVGAADISPAWVDQLTEDGRLVVPLRMRGLTRSIAFDVEDGHLVSRGYELCGFVPMQGAGENRERLVVLHAGDGEQVGLRLDGAPRIDAGPLREAFVQPPIEAWSSLTMGRGMPYDDLDLWLATAIPDYALLATTREARDRGLVASWSPMGISTIIDGGSFAYLTIRPTSPERTLFEFGAHGHGPDAQRAADRLAAEIDAWNNSYRTARPTIRAHPAGIPDDHLPEGLVVDRKHFRITISWSPQ
jgi:protein-L-isoaspartate(D-aspartate) O-methyltransferase